MSQLGGFFGWLLLATFVGAILNYIVKAVNQRFGKTISQKPFGKKVMKVLMSIFVKNHRFFGLAGFVLLLAHFTIQFSNYGVNLTGGLTASLLTLEIILGIRAHVKKLPRKGRWFILHRLIGALIVFAIALHLIAPYSLNALIKQEESQVSDEVQDTQTLTTFTLEELATYNGKDGNPAYVAYKGNVYDVTDHPKWKQGTHNGQFAGSDLTDALSQSPHGNTVFEDLEIVGNLQ